jgi:hypothetical protein
MQAMDISRCQLDNCVFQSVLKMQIEFHVCNMRPILHICSG